jgi:hypothetical protein
MNPQLSCTCVLSYISIIGYNNLQTYKCTHLPMPISVKFHYNWIKSLKKPFMITMATVAIFKITNPKCTSTHPKDHSCHKGLKYSSGYILRSINSWCLLKNSMGNFFLQEKNIFWSDCNEISQEWSLGCVDVHLGFVILKMATVAMVIMNMCYRKKE